MHHLQVQTDNGQYFEVEAGERAACKLVQLVFAQVKVDQLLTTREYSGRQLCQPVVLRVAAHNTCTVS